jgi:hypothetical protein
MFLTSLTFQTIPKGAFVGTLAFVLEVGNSPHLLTSASWVVGTLVEVSESLKVKTKHLRIRGNLSSGMSEEEAFTLATSAQNMGFLVSVEYPGNRYPSWLSSVGYKIAIVEKEYLQTPCNELWYILQEDLQEPKVLSSSPPIRYVDPSNRSLEELFKFVEKSPHPWNVLVKTVNYKIRIRGEGVTDDEPNLVSFGNPPDFPPSNPLPLEEGKKKRGRKSSFLSPSSSSGRGSGTEKDS